MAFAVASTPWVAASEGAGAAEAAGQEGEACAAAAASAAAAEFALCSLATRSGSSSGHLEGKSYFPMTASASESWARTAGGAESINATIEALTWCLTSGGMAAAVEVEGAPLPLAVTSVVFSASSSEAAAAAGSHLNLTWFLKATAAAWRSSTGASVEMNWRERESGWREGQDVSVGNARSSEKEDECVAFSLSSSLP